jgi:1-acyl-sn-glycerol-3-phosphate acyltransferase
VTGGRPHLPTGDRNALTLFRALDFRFDVTGLEFLPADGGAVLAANHVSYFDFMFVGFPAHLRGRRLVRFLAKKSVFDHPLSGPLMRGMRHIPVDRAVGAGAYRRAVDALQRGELVGVFPEQTISRSFLPRPMKSGAARMALEAGAPLLPVVTWGGQRVWTVGRRPRLRRHVPVQIRVGAPVVPDSGEDATTLTERLARTLREMVDGAVRTYPQRPDVDDDWWWPASAGGSAPTPEEAAAADLAAITGRRRHNASA